MTTFQLRHRPEPPAARPSDGTGPRPVLVIIGPSGGGKSTVVRILADRGVLRVHPTWTTRPRRADEARGSVEHRFLSEAQFDHLQARGFFADSVALFGLPYRYGLPPLRLAPVGPVDTVMLRAPLLARFAAAVPHHVVYQVEDRPERVMARLAGRNSGHDDLEARLLDNRAEVEAGRRVAHRVFVNDRSLSNLADAMETAIGLDVGAAT